MSVKKESQTEHIVRKQYLKIHLNTVQGSRGDRTVREYNFSDWRICNMHGTYYKCDPFLYRDFFWM